MLTGLRGDGSAGGSHRGTCYIGEKTVIDINTSMGDVSQARPHLALHSGQRVRQRALARIPGPGATT